MKGEEFRSLQLRTIILSASKTNLKALTATKSLSQLVSSWVNAICTNGIRYTCHISIFQPNIQILKLTERIYEEKSGEAREELDN